MAAFDENTELELELIQSHIAQKPVLRGEVGCACVAREVSAPPAGFSALLYTVLAPQLLLWYVLEFCSCVVPW